MYSPCECVSIHTSKRVGACQMPASARRKQHRRAFRAGQIFELRKLGRTAATMQALKLTFEDHRERRVSLPSQFLSLRNSQQAGTLSASH